jgi:O-antigen/teichoic acid export membrane protein
VKRTDAYAPRAAVGQAGWLVLQRGLDLGRALVFAALVPRLIGPEIFGQYSLVTSIATWFALLSGFGAAQIMTFFVPPLLKAADSGAVARLFGGLLVLRVGSGTLSALTFFFAVSLWLRDIDLPALGLVAASVLLRSVANVLFAFRLGLGDAAGWGTGELARRLISLVLVLPGAMLFGLRGALAAVFVTEALLVGLGALGARGHLPAGSLRFDLGEMVPYLRFNAFFLASNIVVAACQRGGESLVRVSGGAYAQVGIFAAAYSVHLLVVHALRQVSTGMGPFLSSLRAEGRHDDLAAWAGRLAGALASAGALVALVTLCLASRAVPLVLGSAFAGAAAVLKPLAWALPFVALGAVLRVLAVIYDRPRVALEAALLQAASLLLAGYVLIPRLGLPGAAHSILAASGAYAGLLAVRLRSSVRVPLRSWTLAVLPALALALPLAFDRGSLGLDLASFAAAAASYVVLARGLGLLRHDALGAVWLLVREAPAEPLPGA